MKTVYKFPLKIFDKNHITINSGYEILKVCDDPAGNPHIYAMVDTEKPIIVEYLSIFGTGQPLPNDIGEYIGSFTSHDMFIWHVFKTN